MSIPDNFLAFTFPNSIFDGSITDAGGTVVYTLTSEKRKFRSDTTTITRPDAGVVGVIRWGSVITLRRRSVALTNATVPTKKYLSEGKANSLGGRNSQVFQDLEGNEYYWKNSECYEGKNQDLVAYYKLAVVDSTLSPRLWVHPDYCSPNVVEPIIITSLLMAKMKKKSSDSADPVRVSSDVPSSRTSHETSSSQRHDTRAAYAGVGGAMGAGGAVGAYAIASGIENDGGAYGGSNNYGGVDAYGSGPGDVGSGGGAGGDYGGADGGGGGAAFGGADAGGYGGGAVGGFDGGAGGGAGGGFGGADGGGGYGGGAGGYGGGYGGGFGGGGGSW